MHKILQNHLLCAFVADLKIDAIYALYPESFCDKNLAIRKVFAFCDSAVPPIILSSLALALQPEGVIRQSTNIGFEENAFVDFFVCCADKSHGTAP